MASKALKAFRGVGAFKGNFSRLSRSTWNREIQSRWQFLFLYFKFNLHRKKYEKSEINVFRLQWKFQYFSAPCTSTPSLPLRPCPLCFQNESQIDLIFDFNYRSNLILSAFNFCWRAISGIVNWGSELESIYECEGGGFRDFIKNQSKRLCNPVKYSVWWIVHNVWIFLIWVDCFTPHRNSAREEEEVDSFRAGIMNK